MRSSYFTKTAKSASKNEVQLFIDEALFLSRVNHPHIVRFIDNGIDETNCPFLILEDLVTASKWENSDEIDSVGLGNALVECLNVLDFLAFLNLSHGDIKPEHILVNTAGKTKLIDFAQIFSLSKETLIGTSAYLAPELFWNYGYSLKSDLFSLGMAFYRMRFQSEEHAELFYKQDSSLIPWNRQDLLMLTSGVENKDPIAKAAIEMLNFSPLARPNSGRDVAMDLMEAGVTNWTLDEYDTTIIQALDHYSYATHWISSNCRLLKKRQSVSIAVKHCHDECFDSFQRTLSILKKFSGNDEPLSIIGSGKSTAVSICKHKYLRGILPRVFPKSAQIPIFDTSMIEATNKIGNRIRGLDFKQHNFSYCCFEPDQETAEQETGYDNGLTLLRHYSICKRFYEGLELARVIVNDFNDQRFQKLVKESYLTYFLISLGKSGEAQAYLKPDSSNDFNGSTKLELAEYLSNIGWCQFLLGNTSASIELLKRAESEFCSSDNRNALLKAVCFNRIASVTWMISGAEAALSYNDQAIETATETGIGELIVSVLLNRCMYLGDCGDIEREKAVYSEISELIRSISSKQLVIHYLFNLSAYNLRRGFKNQALAYAQKALAMARSAKMTIAEVSHLYALLGNIYHAIGNLGKSTSALKTAARSFRKAGNKYNAAKCFQNLAEISYTIKSRRVALKYSLLAEILYNRAGFEPGVCDVNLLRYWFSDLGVSELEKLKLLKRQCERSNYYWGIYQTQLIIAIGKIANRQLAGFDDLLSDIKESSKKLSSLQTQHDMRFLKLSAELIQDAEFDKTNEDFARGLLVLLRRRGTLSYRENKIDFIELLASDKRDIQDTRSLLKRMTQEIIVEGQAMSENTNLNSNQESVSDEAKTSDSRFKVLSEVACLVQSSNSVDEYVSKALEITVKSLNATRGVIFLVSKFSEDVEVLGTFGCDSSETTDIKNVSKSILHHALGGRSIFIRNTASEKNFDGLQSLVSKEIKSAICIPLKKGSEVFGAVYVDSLYFATLFDDLDKSFLGTFGSIIAGGIGSSYRLQKLNSDYHSALNSKTELGLKCSEGLLLPSTEMQEIYRKIFKVAPLPFPILILGQTGSGKDVLARMIHENSKQSYGRFVAINCSAIPAEHLETELFGVAEKAFTNVSGRQGRFDLADGGTLFLDEIAEMPIYLQSKLLRVIESKEFERVGGTSETRQVQFRLLCATNKNLKQLVSEGKFREDLYHRINDVVIQIPDLANRTHDIEVLLLHYFNFYESKLNKKCSPIREKLLLALVKYHWPGGIRELSKIVSRIVAFSDEPEAILGELPEEVRDTLMETINSNSGKNVGPVELNKEKLLTALRKNSYNIRQTAAHLGIPESTLRHNLKRLNIEPTPRRFRA